jgi:hypothetical protein
MDNRGITVQFSVRAIDVILSQHSDWLWCPKAFCTMSAAMSSYGGKADRAFNLTTHFYQVLRLKYL